MACGPCAKRRAERSRKQTDIVPVQPNKPRETNAATQGRTLRDRMRFTGR